MAITTVPKEWREKLGDDGAEALVVFVNTAFVSNKNGLLRWMFLFEITPMAAFLAIR